MNSMVSKHKAEYQHQKNIPVSHVITSYYLNAYVENKDKSPMLRKALTQKNVYESSDITVYPWELVAGRLILNEAVGFHIGCGTYINYDTAKAYVEQEHMTEEERDTFYNKINQVLQRKMLGIM